MAPHIVGAEIIQLPIPSYGVKSCLSADDRSVLWSIPNFEHALTGIAKNCSRNGMQLSLDIVKQRLVHHSSYMVVYNLIVIEGRCIGPLRIRSQALIEGRRKQNTLQLARKSVASNTVYARP